MKDCNNCKHRECWGQSEPCDDCTNLSVSDGPTNWEPQTNADRIRAMTDEELAGYLIRIETKTLQKEGIYPFEDEITTATQECLDWLKQEVDDGN